MNDNKEDSLKTGESVKPEISEQSAPSSAEEDSPAKGTSLPQIEQPAPSPAEEDSPAEGASLPQIEQPAPSPDGNTAPPEKPARRRKFRLHEYTPGHDIRYRGPLNWQHFQILGWFAIISNTVVLLMRIGNRISYMKGALTNWIGIFSNIAPMALPFLLLANFAQILNNKSGYKKLLLKNGAATLAVASIFYFFYYRYFLGFLSLFSEDPDHLIDITDQFFSRFSRGGFYEFNIFLDLFLCVLFMFFLNARPRRIFTGRKIIILRLMALLPILYEIGCTILKYNAAMNHQMLPAWIYPLLPAKPPMTFVLFLALSIYIKTREFRFCRHGRTHAEYREFLKTRRNSLNVSVFLAAALILVGIIDMVIYGYYYLNELLAAQEQFAAAGMTVEESVGAALDVSTGSAITHVGFGESIILIGIAPLALLFSYNREPKYPELGAYIPLASIVLMILLMIQGTYQILKIVDLPKFNLTELFDSLVANFQSLSL